MTLTWFAPEDNGGSSISGYVIERKEARSDRWLRINKNYVTMTRYRSSGLIEGLEYEHRITAVNSRGLGKPSESSAITVAMDPIGELLKKGCYFGKIPLALFSSSRRPKIFLSNFFSSSLFMDKQNLQVLQSNPKSQTAPGLQYPLLGYHLRNREVLSSPVTLLRCKRLIRWNGPCATPHLSRCASTLSPTCHRVQNTSLGSSLAILVVMESLRRFLLL